MATIQRKASEKIKSLYDFGRYLVNTFESSDVRTFDYDPIRNSLFMKCKRENEEPSSLFLKGIFKAEVFTEDSLDEEVLCYELTDIGTLDHARIPRGELNPPQVFFTISGITEYRFWCRSAVINGEEFEISKLRLFPEDREELGVPDDWQPPTENPRKI